MIFLLPLLIALLPDKPLPVYLPGDDVVIHRKDGDGVYTTLTGKQAIVTDLHWNKYTRRIEYDMNTQGWGDSERTSAANIVTRRGWEVMKADFMRDVCYPSWWMPFVEREPE